MVYGGIKILKSAKDVAKDCRFVYDLRNRKYVRDVSWNAKKFSYEDHKKWYKKNYKNIFIIADYEHSESYYGFVRVDEDGSISIAILKEQQNKNLGHYALEELSKHYDELKAEVKVDNLRSLSFFIKEDFRLAGWILKRKNEFMKRL